MFAKFIIGCSHNLGEFHFIELREYFIGYPKKPEQKGIQFEGKE